MQRGCFVWFQPTPSWYHEKTRHGKLKSIMSWCIPCVFMSPRVEFKSHKFTWYFRVIELIPISPMELYHSAPISPSLIKFLYRIKSREIDEPNRAMALWNYISRRIRKHIRFLEGRKNIVSLGGHCRCQNHPAKTGGLGGMRVHPIAIPKFHLQDNHKILRNRPMTECDERSNIKGIFVLH